ncbi:hypothetical protein AJ79_03696 [Helicocarpus griseus UAMH5409]|uniref:F-box domain-containing protein n=1 Tax=Helicocarpus griseus UAMH5409 TaxID=1447875 RepID=A0A2B7XY65_9EURO|nr:hypothetical protein AJ79_03696 [Helicocarpus griseus UAMH5409]
MFETPSPSPSPSQTTPSPFTTLPTDLLLEIAAYLKPLPKLCLALTCKSLLHKLDGSKTLRQSRKFRALIDDLNPCCCPAPDTVLGTHRWRLLRRLEDERWKCCSGCLKLHPVEEFAREELEKGADERKCVFGKGVGVVALCPCKTMTVREKGRMIRELAATSAEAEKAEGHCWHECSYTYDSAKVSVKITPRLELGELVLDFRYYIEGKILPGNLRLVRRTACPHSSLYVLLRKDRQARNESCDSGAQRCGVCQTVTTDIFWIIDEGTGYTQVSFRTERSLGRDTVLADKKWDLQSYFPFKKVVRLSEGVYCPWKQ